MAPVVSGNAFRGQIVEVDGLRGIAILLVMLSHFSRFRGELPMIGKAAETGWIGVDLFFVISGFLICGILIDNLRDPNFFQTFYVRRVLRIFPLYYLILIGVTIVAPALGVSRKIIDAGLTLPASPYWYFLYLGNLREVAMRLGGVPNPLWSLAIEEQFYLMFPLVVWLMRGRVSRLLVAVLIAAPLLRLVTFLWLPDLWIVQYLSTPARADAIAYGCLLAVMLRSGKLRVSRMQINLFLAAAVVLLGVAFFIHGLDQGSPYCRLLGFSQIAITFALLLLWTLLHRGAPAAALLRAPVLLFIGRRCYGLYLFHQMAGEYVGAAARYWGLHPAVAFLLKFLAPLLLASISWRYFEAPILKLKDRFSSWGDSLRPVRSSADTVL